MDLVCWSSEERCRVVYWNDPDFSTRRQGRLLGVTRASLYYQPAEESEENLRLMRLIAER